MNDFTIAEPIMPGEYIRDFLESKGWGQEDLARIMNRPLKTISQIVTGKTAITLQTAKELAAAFNTNPKFWINLETNYRLQLDRQKEGGVEKRRALYELAPIREMEKRGWIKQTADEAAMEAELKTFFGVESLDEEPHIPVAARTSNRIGVRPTMEQRAWVFRAAKLASLVSVVPYAGKITDHDIEALRKLAAYAEGASSVSRLLAEIGIRFVIVEHLSKTKLDGAAFWLGPNSPVIAMSLRFDRIDYFWHTFFHELVHVKRNDCALDSELMGDPATSKSELEEYEKSVDEEASSLLIPTQKLNSFIGRSDPFYSKIKVIQFAHTIKIHPGIIVGQLQHRGSLNYTHMRDMLVNVRSFVTTSALTDGWNKTVSI